MSINSFRYVLRESIFSVWRNPWLSIASVVTVMISLVILGFSLFFLANASNMAKTFESELEISVFLENNTGAEQIRQLENEIKGLPEVASVLLVSKEQALAGFGKTMGGNQTDLLSDMGGVNPFPDKFTIKVNDPEIVKTLAEKISTFSGVEKVSYGKDFIDSLLSFTNWLRWVGIGIIIAFAVASIILISINIKMNVFSRRREIQIMKLVGATNGFIRWPFFVEGLFLGLIGGGLATLIVGFTYQLLIGYIQTTLVFLPVVQDPIFFKQVLGGLLILGMGIGAIGSAISLHKFLQV